MNTLSIRLRYRPLRLGWCVLRGDIEAFRRAMRLSFTMWGGRYNPVIPVDDPDLAKALVKLFRVDALVAVSVGPIIDTFLAAHKHLPWPMIAKSLFVDTMHDGKAPAIVDISHPAARLCEAYFKNNPNPQPGLDFYEWETNDPLADVFLCTYGGFPPADETGINYAALAQSSLLGVPSRISNGSVVHPPRPDRETIASLSRAYVKQHYAVQNHWDWPGFYIGEAENFDDLVSFWNLRAADIQMMFFDPRFANRLGLRVTHLATALRQRPSPQKDPEPIGLWHRGEQAIDDIRRQLGDDEVMSCNVDGSIWNGLNIRVPIMYFGEGAALASIDDGGRTATMSFALTDKPFAADHDLFRQHYVLSIDPGIGLLRNEQATLHAPFIPQLNEYYGRNVLSVWNTARSEPESLGIVTSVSADHKTLRALNVNQLITEVFGAVGIEAAPSRPGNGSISSPERSVPNSRTAQYFRICLTKASFAQDWDLFAQVAN